MPIILPRALPARTILLQEGLTALPADGPLPRGALQVAVLNLMPTKIATEVQLARVLASTPLWVEPTLLRTATHAAVHADPQHLDAFYRTWDDVRRRRFDGLIVTGAPVETLPWEAVDYWDELRGILDWSTGAVGASLFICWGAQAALHHFHGIPKQGLPAKRFGVYPHHLADPASPLVRGHDDDFLVPVSRHTETPRAAVAGHGALRILAEGPEAGLHLVHEPAARCTYLFNHPEYDADTLDREYRRDRDRGLPIALPVGYYPDDDPARPPRVRWRSHAHHLYANWLAQEVLPAAERG